MSMSSSAYRVASRLAWSAARRSSVVSSSSSHGGAVWRGGTPAAVGSVGVRLLSVGSKAGGDGGGGKGGGKPQRGAVDGDDVLDEYGGGGAVGDDDDELLGADGADNALEGKETRANLHDALRGRAADAVRYEYLAQRAEVEGEADAAALFHGVAAIAKQQAMGHLEILEDYGDVEFASTLDNVDNSADAEKYQAQTTLRAFAETAAQENLADVEEWFDDLCDAGAKTSHRLNALHAALEDELVGQDEHDEDEGTEALGEAELEALKNRRV